MRTLSAALHTAIGGPVQQPAWFVRLVMTSQTLRYSSFGTVSWNGFTWTAVDMDVTALRVGAFEVRGDLVFGNVDDAFGTIFLNDSPADKAVTIWGYDAAATASGDPVQVADCVGGGATFSTREVRVSLRDACEYKLGPRAVIAPAFGFTALIQAGRTIVINGQSYRIERRR